jgi:hypothetical protein
MHALVINLHIHRHKSEAATYSVRASASFALRFVCSSLSHGPVEAIMSGAHKVTLQTQQGKSG